LSEDPTTLLFSPIDFLMWLEAYVCTARDGGLSADPNLATIVVTTEGPQQMNKKCDGLFAP
jgi:hypothetical protein